MQISLNTCLIFKMLNINFVICQLKIYIFAYTQSNFNFSPNMTCTVYMFTTAQFMWFKTYLPERKFSIIFIFLFFLNIFLNKCQNAEVFAHFHRLQIVLFIMYKIPTIQIGCSRITSIAIRFFLATAAVKDKLDIFLCCENDNTQILKSTNGTPVVYNEDDWEVIFSMII